MGSMPAAPATFMTQSPMAQTVPTGAQPPMLPAGWSRVRMVYNNDPHEKLQSLPQVVTAFDAFSRAGEAEGRDVLRLNGGDNNIGVEADEWKLNVALMNLMRYHAVTMGNHELDIGSRGFAEGLKEANFPVVISNLDVEEGSGIAQAIQSGKLVNRPLIVNGSQGRYGIIGVTTPKIHDVLSPKVNLEGCDVEDMDDTIEEVQEQVQWLQSQGINRIFMLSHMDIEHDKQLLSKVPGIDVVVSAHDHKVVNGIQPGFNYIQSPTGEPVLLVEGGKNNSFMGVMDATFDPNGVLRPESNTLFNPGKFPANPLAEAIRNQTLGVPRALANVTTDYSADNNSFEPDPIAQFTADAMRAVTGADLAFVRSAELRTHIPAGSLTDQVVKELMPFTDPVVRIKLTGDEIWQALALSAQCLKDGESHPGMLHPSGLAVQMNKGSGGVDAVYVFNQQANSWQPLLPDGRTYSVAVGEFSVLNKGEFKSMAKEERIEWRSNAPVRSFFELALKLSGAPNKPLGFQDDGRLRIV